MSLSFPAPPQDVPRPALDPQTPGELVELILRSANILRGVLAPALAQLGLNDARWAVLQAVRGTGMDGCSQIELAQELQHSESNVSTLLERMRSDGLISRQRSAADRRKSLIQLTPEGDALLAQVLGSPLFRTHVLFAGLVPTERHALRLALEALLRDWIRFPSGNDSHRTSAPNREDGTRATTTEAPEVHHAKAG
jgi:DNA-binding MarR family transcriptional regulator